MMFSKDKEPLFFQPFHMHPQKNNNFNTESVTLGWLVLGTGEHGHEHYGSFSSSLRLNQLFSRLHFISSTTD